MRWDAAGLGAYANMRFPQWAFSHRPCARSGRTRSKSSWWCLTGPIGLGSQNWYSSRQPLLGKFLWGGIYFLREGAPVPRLVEPPRMVLGRDAEVLSGLPPAVVNTITSARALSTRQAYRLKWNLFINWCSPRREDPRRCPIAVVLSFLQDGLERRLSPSTLKVYVAAIAAHHDAVDGKSLGKHDLVIRFLRGARRLNPPRPHLVPSWDLPSVLSALRGAPFEPLQSVELKFLSLKTVLLSALATVKRVGDLQAFSGDDSCLEFGPADSHVVLRQKLWAWICAQSSHHALQGPGGELASAAPGGGRPRHCSALSRSCLAHLCGPHAELQDLRPALCLLRRTAEGKSCL